MAEDQYENATLTYSNIMLGTAHGQKTPSNDYMELTSTQQPPNDYMQPQDIQPTSATDFRDAEQCVGEQKLSGKKYPQHRKCLTIIAVIVFMVVVLIVSLMALALAVFSFYSGSTTERSLNETSHIYQLGNEIKKTENKINILSTQLSQLSNETNVSHMINAIHSELVSIQTQVKCGPGEWRHVVYLNMSDPSQQCPLNWTESTYNGNIRTCRRPDSSGSGCASTYYSITNQYSQVCGRAIAYQFNSPDAFSGNTNLINDINAAYMDGISVTHGLSPRNHIWSFVAGVSERSTSLVRVSNCPCSSVPGSPGPPSFVGGSYYCESGNPTDSIDQFFPVDKLWDGKQCEGTCCTGNNSCYIPWFSVRLPQFTTSKIEVRICGDESTSNENTPIELLEIYVQ